MTATIQRIFEQKEIKLYQELLNTYTNTVKEDPFKSEGNVYAQAFAFLASQVSEKKWASTVNKIPSEISALAEKLPSDKLKADVHWLIQNKISEIYLNLLKDKIASAATPDEKMKWEYLQRFWNTLYRQDSNVYFNTKDAIAFGGVHQSLLPLWYNENKKQ